MSGKVVGRDGAPKTTQKEHLLYRAYYGPGPSASLSQLELESLYQRTSRLSGKEKLHADPDSEFGSHLNLTLEEWNSLKLSDLAEKAFPESQAMLRLARKLFNEQLLTIELVSKNQFPDASIKAISADECGVERMIVAYEPRNIRLNQDPLQGFYYEYRAPTFKNATDIC